MNKNLLRSKMALNNDTYSTLAKELDISTSRLSAKVNSTNAQFTQNEITVIKDRYSLSPEEVDNIFFNQ